MPNNGYPILQWQGVNDGYPVLRWQVYIEADNTLQPGSIESAEAFGDPRVSFIAQPTGIPSAEVFGTAKLSITIEAQAITSGEAFGSHFAIWPVQPTGIPSAESFGGHRVSALARPQGITSAESFGAPDLGITIKATGIASAEAFGGAKLHVKIEVTGIPSAEAFGALICRLKPIGVVRVYVGEAYIPDIISGTMNQDLGGDWSANFRAVLATSPALEYGDEVEIQNQPFIVTEHGVARTSEGTFLDITAAHKVFFLEQNIISQDYTFEGNVIEHLEKLLTFQDGSIFTVEVEPTVTGSTLEEFLEVQAKLDITIEQLYRGIQNILEQFLARIRPDGDVIYVMPRDHAIPSDISFEYGFNNIDVQRAYDMDSVTRKLVAKAWLRGYVLAGEIDPVIVKEYGSGTPARFKDLGTLNSQTSMDRIAGRYLNEHDSPAAEYQMSVVDLLRMSKERRPVEASDTKINVGLGVHVVDAELGIDDTLLVHRYSYSLTEPYVPARVTVGSLRQELSNRQFISELVSAVSQAGSSQPRLYTSTDPLHEPDPEMGKEGDVFVRPKG